MHAGRKMGSVLHAPSGGDATKIHISTPPQPPPPFRKRDYWTPINLESPFGETCS